MRAKNSSDGGEAILQAIRQLGCDYVFSSPGSEWSAVWEAFARQRALNKEGPVYLDCWHETLAVDMAIGYTQFTGRIQTVILHAGQGLLQGSMGIQCAQVHEIPMLIMSGESLTYGEDPEFEPGPQWYHALSIVGGPQRLAAPITKWSSQATSIHTLFETMVRGGELAQRHPKGPVYVNVPIEVTLDTWHPPASLRQVPAAPIMQPRASDIDQVATRLIKAKFPFVVVEEVGRDPVAFRALIELAELLALPVVEAGAPSYANFPKDHPLHQGGNRQPFLKDADLALLVATPTPWYPPQNKPARAHIVAISDNSLKGHVVYQNLHANTYLEGDVATTLRLLIDNIRARGVTAAQYGERRARWEASHASQETERRSVESAARDKSPIDPYWLAGTLREVMPADVIYVDETVVHRRLLQHRLNWSTPQSYFTPRGGLGQGLGWALGCKLAAPERPVVLLIGDGSLLYNPLVQAFGASRQYGLPVLIIVFNNRGYEAMRQNHIAYYPDGVAFGAKDYYGVHIAGPEYSELGKPFGFSGRRVERPGELADALREGLSAIKGGKTFILDIALDGENPRKV